MDNNEEKIQITWDDVESAQVSAPGPAQNQSSLQNPTAQQNQSWGNIPDAAEAAATETGGGPFYMKSWFYLGVAGFVGAFVAWMACEPSFHDGYGSQQGIGNFLLFPTMAMFTCIALGTVESIVERSWTKAILRGLAAAGLGLILGGVFSTIADIVFGILIRLLLGLGANIETLVSNPIFWGARALAWAAFGMAGGLIFGIVSKSGKKTTYGMLGGVIGAAIGGMLFDPISLLTNGGEASRAIGLGILGCATGVAIGLVEAALKERWLYVAAGPLAGKQFVLYQDLVTLGKSQSNTIYLFKDPNLLDQHAIIDRRGGQSFLTAYGPVVISGQTLQGQAQHALRHGDMLQIGRYTFSYAESERSMKRV